MRTEACIVRDALKMIGEEFDRLYAENVTLRALYAKSCSVQGPSGGNRPRPMGLQLPSPNKVYSETASDRSVTRPLLHTRPPTPEGPSPILLACCLKDDPTMPVCIGKTPADSNNSNENQEGMKRYHVRMVLPPCNSDVSLSPEGFVMPNAPQFESPSQWTCCDSQQFSVADTDDEVVMPEEKRKISKISNFSSMRDSFGGTHSLFGDTRDMKSKVKEHMMMMAKPVYRVEHLYKDKGWAQSISRSTIFENITLSIIVFNALWISIDTDLNHADSMIDANPVFIVAEQFFAIFFTSEIILRFCSFKRKLSCLRDSWFCFDFVLVVLMDTDAWFMPLITYVLTAEDRSGQRQMGNATILRLAKLLRLMRMLRISRLVRQMPEFFILVKAILAAMRAVFFTLAFLFIILYVFGVAFTSILRDSDIGALRFYSVPKSIQTLTLHVVLVDNLCDLIDAVEAENLYCSYLLYIVIIVATITIMNILIGVLCESINSVADTERTALHVQRVQNSLQKLLLEDMVDADNDGLISKDEFEKMIMNTQATRALEEIDVDVVGLIDIAETIFATEIGSGTFDRKLTFEEFMEILLQMRGSNKATVRDVVELRKDIHKVIQKLDATYAIWKTGHAAQNPIPRGRSSSSTTRVPTKPSDKADRGSVKQCRPVSAPADPTPSLKQTVRKEFLS